MSLRGALCYAQDKFRDEAISCKVGDCLAKENALMDILKK
jgi:hypothetical protein